MNWKRILILSLCLNLLLLLLISHRYDLSKNDLVDKWTKTIIESECKQKKIIKSDQRVMSYRMIFFPTLKSLMNDIVDKMNDQQSEAQGELDTLIIALDKYVDSGGSIDDRTVFWEMLGNERGAHILSGKLDCAVDSLHVYFENALDTLRDGLYKKPSENYINEFKSRINKIDFASKLKKSKGISVIEANLLLHAMKMDLTNLSYQLHSVILQLIPERYSERYDLYKLMVHPKKTRIPLGTPFEAEMSVVGYSSRLSKKAVLTVKGKEYFGDTTGIIHCQERVRHTGVKELKLHVKITGPNTGVMSNSSSVIDLKAYE